jgi:hypothetical protein
VTKPAMGERQRDGPCCARRGDARLSPCDLPHLVVVRILVRKPNALAVRSLVMNRE